MRKNVASQTIGAQLVDASDGSAFTGTVDVFVTGDGGTQAAGTVNSGEAVHEGNGYHSYAPSQAETNFDHVAFTFVATGAVPATVQVYTTFPQTGDGFARLGAPVGASISADLQVVDGVVDAILLDTAAIDGRLPSDPADASVIAGLIGTAQADLDVLTGADGATLATSQPNYAPAKAGDEMALEDDAITPAKLDGFGVAGKVDANITHVNETEVAGDGGTGTEWGPA